MGIAEELQRLHELHQRGALTDEEFAQAKAALLAGPPADVQDQLKDIARHQEIERIDREWQQARDRYMVTETRGGAWVQGRHVGGYPVRTVPTKAGSVLSGVFVVVAGVVWMAFATGVGASAFALFGLVFIAIGVGMSLHPPSPAGPYERARPGHPPRPPAGPAAGAAGRPGGPKRGPPRRRIPRPTPGAGRPGCQRSTGRHN